MDQIIRINKKDVFTFCILHAGISGCGFTCVGLMECDDPLVMLCALFTYLAGLVCTSIINKDQFEIRECLLKDTVHALMQILFSIINRNNNAYGGHNA